MRLWISYKEFSVSLNEKGDRITEYLHGRTTTYSLDEIVKAFDTFNKLIDTNQLVLTKEGNSQFINAFPSYNTDVMKFASSLPRVRIGEEKNVVKELYLIFDTQGEMIPVFEVVQIMYDQINSARVSTSLDHTIMCKSVNPDLNRYNTQL
tara:strand:+ start:857 stop:1306 length:450 start_codon:yes stop_codon:yes gene_type:complete